MDYKKSLSYIPSSRPSSTQASSPASTPPPSEIDADENEDIRLDFEHLDDVVATPALQAPQIGPIPEACPLLPKTPEQMRAAYKLWSGSFQTVDIANVINHGGKTAKPLPGSEKWSVGYFADLSSGRGDLWRERSVWNLPQRIGTEAKRNKENDAKKLNANGGHGCAVLFWGW